MTVGRTRPVAVAATTTLLVVVLLLAGTGSVAGTPGCEPINGTAVIDESGCYRLTEGVQDSGATVLVEIRASDVILDGMGHTLDGSGSYDTIGVYVNGSATTPLGNVTVRNVTATEWETGIYFRNVAGGTVRDVTSSSNEHQGIQFRDSSNVLVEDVVTADNPGTGEGVLVVDASDVAIENLTSMREGMGVDFWDVTGATIRNSTFREGSDGIDLDDSGGVVIDGNAFENGGAVSSSGTGVAPNHVTNNTVTGDQWDGYCGGFSFRSAEDDVVANNTLDGCYRGMYVHESYRLTIRDNVIDNDPTYGNNNNYGIEVTAGGDNTLVNNTITNSGTPGWDEPGIVLGSTERAYLSGNTLLDNPVNLRVRGYSWAEVDHVIEPTNTVEGRPVYYHVNGSAGSVTVPTDAGWVGLVGTTGATVADVAFPANNQENVYLWGTHDTVIRNVTATGSRHAVWADNGNDGLLIEDSTFDNAGAIYLHQSTDSLVSNTTVVNSGGNGADLYRASGTTFESVTIRNSDAHAIQIKADSDHVSIANSTLQSGDLSAIYTAQNTNLSITDNTITDNGGGGVSASVYWMRNTTIRGNVISNNDGNGVYLYRHAQNATIVGNEITGNDGDGVSIGFDSANARVVDNNVSHNAGNGIDLGGNGRNGRIAGNVVAGNDVGLDLSSTYVDLAIYDNHLNNTLNLDVPSPSGPTNTTWNTTATAGTNVVGGATVGGNVWALPNGTGFSQTCTDRGDGICDAEYTIAGDNVDFLPLAALDGGTAPADVAVSIDGTNSPVEAGETLEVTVTVENTGEADVTRTITLEVNGSTVANRSVTLAGGNATTITLSYVTDEADVGHRQAVVSSGDDGDSATVEVTAAHGESEDVIVNGITVTNGTDPGSVPYVEAWIDDQPMLQLNLRTDEFGGYDLEPSGFDSTTEFEIRLTVANFTPRLLLGSGNVTGWERTPNGSATDVTVRVRPVSSEAILECDGNTCTTPDLNDWPTGANDTATDRENATVTMALADLDGYDAAHRDALDGAVIATDAQLFDDPVYVPAGGGQQARLSLLVGGPHYAVDGSENAGFYDAFLPDALLSTWNVTDPDQLTTAYRGNGTAFEAEAVPGGMRIHVPLHYSAGEVVVSSSAGEGSPDVSVTPTTLEFGGVAVDGSATADVTVTNAGDATLNVTGVTVSGTDAAAFTATPVAIELAPGDSRAVAVEFAPTTPGGKAAAVEVTSNDSDEPTVTVPVGGLAVDATPPTVDVVAVTGSAASGDTVYANGTVAVAVAAADDHSAVERVRVTLDSTAARFAAAADATSDDPSGTWTVTFDADDVPDDGNYSVVAVATDATGNQNGTFGAETVVVDRTPPELGASLSRVDETTAAVNLSASESLRPGSVDVTVTLPNDTVRSVTVDGSAGEWNGTFAVDQEGQYRIEASGVDLAGNRGADNATSTFRTLTTTNGTVTVVLEPSGTFIRFNTSADVTDTYVVLTDSRTPLAPLRNDRAGLNFLRAQLGAALADNLTDATIGVPVDELRLPRGAGTDDVNLSYFNRTTKEWEDLGTEIRTVTINGSTDQYWVTEVDHFSTYGAVVTDDTAPTLDGTTPTQTLPAGTTQTTVRFDYSDDISGVNVGSVEFVFDGSTVSGTGLSVTSGYASYDATGLFAGTYDATVTLEDGAGNPATFAHSFTIAAAPSGGNGNDDGETSDDGDDDDDRRSDDRDDPTPTERSPRTATPTGTATVTPHATASPTAASTATATPATSEPVATATTRTTTPGFTAGTALLALLAAVGLVARRRR